MKLRSGPTTHAYKSVCERDSDCHGRARDRYLPKPASPLLSGHELRTCCMALTATVAAWLSQRRQDINQHRQLLAIASANAENRTNREVSYISQLS